MEENRWIELIVGLMLLATIIGISIWGVFMFLIYSLFFAAILVIICAAAFFSILGICYLHEKTGILQRLYGG
jgi:hypothetical protein